MWSRCWWATWVSGFFGITGLLHLARLAFPVAVRIGTYEVPMAMTVSVGVACLGISAGFLWIEVVRARAARRRSEPTAQDSR